jgi:L-seryl-tRNA(Ser) seleniumtransferase
MGNKEAIVNIPTDLSGLKNEVIVQKAHRYEYDHAMRNCGVKVVEVETAEQYQNAFSEKTVMTNFFNAENAPISREEWIRVAHQHGVPCFNDAAADVPPISNLWNYTQMGFDLVAFSGGKGIRGPQSAGLLLGRTSLIEAARLNASPNSDAIGRGMKVNKEEILGMMVAVEVFMKKDHTAERAGLPTRRSHCRAGKVPAVEASFFPIPVANHVRICSLPTIPLASVPPDWKSCRRCARANLESNSTPGPEAPQPAPDYPEEKTPSSLGSGCCSPAKI